ncbi:MAG: hypothetical protein WCE30_00545 [Mycobacterium sp.]
MSVALAEPRPAVFYEGHAMPEPSFVEYLWSDLRARRSALSLWPDVLAPLLHVDLARYLTAEYDRVEEAPERLVDQKVTPHVFAAEDRLRPDDVPTEYIIELDDMEEFVADEAQRLIDSAPTDDVVRLEAATDQEAFAAEYPEACTRIHLHPYPVVLQYVAVGRAAAELRRQGREVDVYRGDRRFDLAAARFAIGLGKAETAYLLDINPKTYNKNEAGKEPTAPRTPMRELQRLDDFIEQLAGTLEVTYEDGFSVIWIQSAEAEFEVAYPNVVERSGNPYPVRTMWVAAGRRAGALLAAGASVRVALTDNL